jgi:hypothetical protein
MLFKAKKSQGQENDKKKKKRKKKRTFPCDSRLGPPPTSSSKRTKSKN